MLPGRVQEVHVAVLGSLGDQLHRDPVPPEVLPAVGAEGLGEAAGAPGLAVPQVVERYGLREPGVELAGGLADGAQVALGGVGVGDQEPTLVWRFRRRSTTPSTLDSLFLGNSADSHRRVRVRQSSGFEPSTRQWARVGPTPRVSAPNSLFSSDTPKARQVPPGRECR